jgi:uncharacterized tellurite resistance protein B-like protein
MAENELILSLAKVIVAAAWADGKLEHDEVNSLKDLLFRLPDLTASDWAELDIYIDSPIEFAERERLLDDLQHAIRSEKDKRLARQTLQAMIDADGEVTQEERAVADEIQSAIDAADTGLIGTFGRLLIGPLQRRQQAMADAPNREKFLEDFLKNRIFYQVRRRMDLGEAELDLPEEVLRKLSLAGGLMARVAHVDEKVSESERESMIIALQQGWDLGEEAAALVAEIALAEFSAGMDFYRLTREFFEATSRKERIKFAETLFRVAAADGDIAHDETEEIRRIANGLKLTHKQFIQAKLKASEGT